MIAEGHPHSEKFREGIDEVHGLWATLRKALDDRQAALEQNAVAQQYLFDASEAEAWMGEQELYLMGDEKAKDEQGANNAMKKHELLQRTIENYASEIRSLGDRSRAMVEAGHPESEAVAAKQSRVDKMYAGLHDLCLERRLRLEEILKLYSLLREILDLEVSHSPFHTIRLYNHMGVIDLALKCHIFFKVSPVRNIPLKLEMRIFLPRIGLKIVKDGSMPILYLPPPSSLYRLGSPSEQSSRAATRWVPTTNTAVCCVSALLTSHGKPTSLASTVSPQRTSFVMLSSLRVTVKLLRLPAGRTE